MEAVGDHGGSKCLLGRFGCSGDPFEGSAQILEDIFDTPVLFLWESIDAINGML